MYSLPFVTVALHDPAKELAVVDTVPQEMFKVPAVAATSRVTADVNAAYPIAENEMTAITSKEVRTALLIILMAILINDI
jgi:hypothetical protein